MSSLPSLRVTPEQLEIWPDRVRGAPNSFIRSAIYSVGNHRDARRHMKRERITSLAGITIFYTGEELRQDDGDVYDEIVHRSRLRPIGAPVQFTAHNMLTELGWTKNSKSYERLRGHIERLNASAITVQTDDGRKGYSGSMIRSFRWLGEDGNPLQHWEILLEREIVNLYGPTQYTRLEWKLSLSLPPMAKWLYKFYASHDTPYPYSVEKFYKLTGSRIASLRQFRYKLREALDLLVDRGFLLEFQIEARSDLVHVKRARSTRLALE